MLQQKDLIHEEKDFKTVRKEIEKITDVYTNDILPFAQGILESIENSKKCYSDSCKKLLSGQESAEMSRS